MDLVAACTMTCVSGSQTLEAVFQRPLVPALGVVLRVPASCRRCCFPWLHRIPGEPAVGHAGDWQTPFLLLTSPGLRLCLCFSFSRNTGISSWPVPFAGCTALGPRGPSGVCSGNSECRALALGCSEVSCIHPGCAERLPLFLMCFLCIYFSCPL